MNTTLINTQVQPFKATAFHNGKFVDVTEQSLKGKWSIVFFYPADFTFVCPTELGDLADRYAEFQKILAEEAPTIMMFSADVLTGSGLVFAVLTAWAIGTDRHHLAVLLLTATGLHDLLDGPVAKASSRASIRGSFFDSVTDRVSDGVLLGGVAYYLEMQHRGSLILLPFAILTSTFMISYQRSKAESLGLAAKGGLMERAERIIALCVGLLIPPLLIPILWLMLALISVTAVQRFVKVWRQASQERPPTPRARRAARRRAVRATRSSAWQHRVWPAPTPVPRPRAAPPPPGYGPPPPNYPPPNYPPPNYPPPNAPPPGAAPR